MGCLYLPARRRGRTRQTNQWMGGKTLGYKPTRLSRASSGAAGTGGMAKKAQLLRNSYGTPSEILRKSYGPTRRHLLPASMPVPGQGRWGNDEGRRKKAEAASTPSGKRPIRRGSGSPSRKARPNKAAERAGPTFGRRTSLAGNTKTSAPLITSFSNIAPTSTTRRCWWCATGATNSVCTGQPTW